MASTAAEPDAFFEANPSADTVDAFYTNLSGVPRGKRLRRHELAGLYRDGVALPGSVMVVDITGLDLADDGMVWADGDADRVARPVAGTLSRAPWLGDRAAQVMLSMRGLDGQPAALDPRVILQRVVDRFTADGLTPVVACELEFYLIDAVRAADGGIQVAPGPDGRRPRHAQVYGLDEIEADAGFLRDLWDACAAMGVPAGAAVSEYAPGQLEVTLAHRAALAACDDAVRFKRAAKGCAAVHGRTATFMAKPFADQPGSGLHLHVSVDDAAGRNIFADEAEDGTPALRHAIGGVCDLMADAMLAFAPNANSYRRFRAGGDEPARAVWGLNARTVPVRVPPGLATTRRLEHRIAGADANPYLAAAAVLAGIHDGLRRRTDPGPAVRGTDPGTGERLPTDWSYAIERFARSARLADYLGGAAVDAFALVKRVEQERYNSVVTALDYDWVLRSA
ncbi:MAG: glutamine synthetase family protein [Janthinobacterium lividum]